MRSQRYLRLIVSTGYVLLLRVILLRGLQSYLYLIAFGQMLSFTTEVSSR